MHQNMPARSKEAPERHGGMKMLKKNITPAKHYLPPTSMYVFIIYIQLERREGVLRFH